MEKIFMMDVGRFPTSLDAVAELLQKEFQQESPLFARTEHGKPYLTNASTPLYFSVSHTKNRLFIAVSDENVGLDVEVRTRKTSYLPLLKRFPDAERAEITTDVEFLRHWTVKESVIKWLGGTLAHDLKKLSYIKGQLLYENEQLPVHITVKELDDFLISICCMRDFSQTSIIIV